VSSLATSPATHAPTRPRPPHPLTLVQAAVCDTDPDAATPLGCRIHRPNGTTFEGELPAWRHRSIQLGMLHHTSRGFVEITDGVRPPGGKTRWNSRRRPESYFRGGGDGGPAWLEAPLLHVAQQARHPRHEIAVVPSVRTCRDGSKQSVAHTHCLWVDIDAPDAVGDLDDFLATYPAHLRVESAGSGGQHAYWLLDSPLPALRWTAQGAIEQPIERALHRLAFRVSHYDTIGGTRKLVGADRACAKRGQPMRLAGTRNYKRDPARWARIIEANMALEPYAARRLVGHLPDPPERRRRPMAPRPGTDDDPYKRIAPPDYFQRLARVEVPSSGMVSCPAPDHDDSNPSCQVFASPEEGWWCHGCARGGTIYDFASMLIGGPVHTALRGAAFTAAKAVIVEHYGELR
jgi:hypothetical protein